MYRKGGKRHQKKVATFVFVPIVLGEKFTTALAFRGRPHRWIWNDIGRNSLLGNRKNSQIFNEDFHLPLYLPLCFLLTATKVRASDFCKPEIMLWAGLRWTQLPEGVVPPVVQPSPAPLPLLPLLLLVPLVPGLGHVVTPRPRDSSLLAKWFTKLICLILFITRIRKLRYRALCAMYIIKIEYFLNQFGTIYRNIFEKLFLKK
jgi:hypothetical protein